MPIQQTLTGGNAQVVDLPSGEAHLVWTDPLGNIVVVGFNAEVRQKIGRDLMGSGLAIANGSQLPPKPPHLKGR